ncbi:MAG TPA: ADP-ribosylglycohydrolase family protein [Tepidisphaeraceae bacterium]|nr:ADP-ribosylglycohydrolase family protein [Tepidisphaeraceae bacterium]
MLGAIVGDVIGSRFEHFALKSTKFRLFDQTSRCTDDSIMTVATADALLHERDYRTAYQDYFHRHPNAGYGSSFVVWANRRSTEPYNSWGNGSAMRVSPIGWAFDNLNEVLDVAERSASVSHNHPDGILGAQAVAAAVFLARTTRDRECIRAFIHEGCQYSLDQSIDEIRPTYEFDPSCKGTVPVAIRAFLESTDFENAIRLSISAGGDSDTIACITGAIAHAFYGGIPLHLSEPIFDSYLTAELAQVTREFCNRYSVPV